MAWTAGGRLRRSAGADEGGGVIWLQAVLEKYAEVLPLRVVELDPQWGKGSGQVCCSART